MRRASILLLALVLLLPMSGPALAAGVAEGGKSVLLMETATGTILYERNAHQPLPPASVTKVMTMLLVMEAIDSGALGWEDRVTASEAAAAKGGSQIYLKAGETMSVTDMLKAVAVSSANDCACALAEHIAGSESAFVERMNRRAQELGMADTCFVNCTGLDDSPEADRHRTSAHDIALMSRQLLKYHPDIKRFTTIWMDSVRDGAFGLSNTNKLIRFYDGATGLKTGFTSGAGYCLSASAQREGMELIAVVMGAESSQERFQTCKSLLDYGFAGYALISPELTETAGVPVVLGKAGSVDVRMGESASLLVEKGQRASVATRLELEESVHAPVSQGQRLGTLTVTAGDRILKEIPLVAAEGVERLTCGDLFLLMLKKAAMAEV